MYLLDVAVGPMYAVIGGTFLLMILVAAGIVFGARRTGIMTLLASLPLLIFGSGNMIVSVIGIILFNMTMPITLGIVAEKLPKNPGIAFGLTTAALLLGAVPSFFVMISGKIFLLLPAVLVSAACIYFSAENKKSLEVHEN